MKRLESNRNVKTPKGRSDRREEEERMPMPDLPPLSSPSLLWEMMRFKSEQSELSKRKLWKSIPFQTTVRYENALFQKKVTPNDICLR